jgi:3-oxoadipate enol-lactonase
MEARLHHEWEGPAGAPVVVLSHSLGTSLALWDPQVPALAARFRILRYDTRGHGRSGLIASAFSIADLGRDVLRLLDAQGVDRCHFCGLSIGGLVGMWLGAHAPERLARLVLCNTATRIGTAESWAARIRAAREQGMAAMAPSVMERWFSAGFRAQAPDAVARGRALFESTSPEGFVACAVAIRDADERADAAAIRLPTLVVSGSEDPATPPAEGRAIAAGIPGARYVELPAAHLSNLEAPEAFNAALLGFLAS